MPHTDSYTLSRPRAAELEIGGAIHPSGQPESP
jgi:hypothetical protein